MTEELLAEAQRAVTHNWIAISPDGASLAWVQGTTLCLDGVPLTGLPAERMDRMPAWSPDSKRVAFLSSTGEDGGPELWMAEADSADARRLASIQGSAQWPRWSPDGTRIAYLCVPGVGGSNPALPYGPLTGVIDEAIRNQGIEVVDAATGRTEAVSPPDRHVYDYGWAPDSQRIAAVAGPGPGGRDWWRAALYTIDAASGRARMILQPDFQIGCPRWSPDGRRIAFLGGLMGDQSLNGGDLYTVDAEGGTPANHTAGRATSPSSLVWLSPDEVLFTEYACGGVNLATLDLRSGAIEIRWHGKEEARAAGRLPNLSVAADGRMVALARSTFDVPEEVWAGPIGGWRQVTHHNAGIRAAWGKAESIEFTHEGRRVQAWLLPPKNPGPELHPMVVEAHGGPSGITLPMWRGADSAALLAAAGYYVLMPNPRGSYGQGEEFTRANARDFGYGDLRDILAAVDAAAARYPIDRGRLGIMGWSYGGFLAMFAVTQTARFRAAVAGAGIANWSSYYGQNVVDHWMVPYFGATPYDDPAVYERNSPIRFIRQVKTPTLVLAGERDAECPPAQSYEFWRALKTLGVATELVVYAGEGHALLQAESRRDEARRTLAWFEKHLRAPQLY